MKLLSICLIKSPIKLGYVFAKVPSRGKFRLFDLLFEGDNEEAKEAAIKKMLRTYGVDISKVHPTQEPTVYLAVAKRGEPRMGGEEIRKVRLEDLIHSLHRADNLASGVDGISAIEESIQNLQNGLPSKTPVEECVAA